MGPERGGSKKSFCPKRAGAGESRYLLVVSTGKPGNGESVLTIAHSRREKLSPTLSPASEGWLGTTNGTDPSNRPKHSVDLRIAHLHDDLMILSCKARTACGCRTGRRS